MYRKHVKRYLDFFIALIGLPFFVIIFIIVAPLIVVDDGFPVFYTADRIGKDGKLFRMFKFRSMKNNAPDIRMEDGSTFNAEDDPRATKVGRILRKISVDEVPQFLNVLKGDMSLIGPRPFIPADGWRNNKDKDFNDRLRVRPGITGYTQAYYRNSISQSEKIHFDAEYAKNVTFSLDMKILLKTIISVLKRENIYVKQESVNKK